MSMTHEQNRCKSEKLRQQLDELQNLVQTSAREGRAIHELERDVWKHVLRMGNEALGWRHGRDREFARR